jgi:aspartate aminotransferase
MKLAQRTSQIEASPTLAMSAKAKQLKSQGIDVIDFGVGEPDFDTPEHIKKACIKAIENGFTKYTAAAGIPELKKVLSEKMKKQNNLEYAPEQIIISNGGKHALFNIMMALLDPGDEVILPAPYWVSYPEQVKMAGGVNVVVPTSEKNDFKMTPEEFRKAITPKTKMLILNSPSNPTGGVYSEAELKALADICVEKNIYVCSDECYEDLVYEGEKHVSIASFNKDIYDRTISCFTFSKSYAMTGWRLGYCGGPIEAIKAMSEFQSHTTSNPVSFVQKGGIEAIVGPSAEPLKMMYQEFDKRRKRIVELLMTIPGVTCRVPKGAFYAFPNVSGLFGKTYQGVAINNSMDLCNYLLEKAHIAIVPGSAFGAEGFVRFSYATSMKNIEEGIRRMKEALQ